MHKRTIVPLAVLLVLAAGACSRRDEPPPADESRIDHERNSEFSGPRLRVFLTLEDGTDLSVNSADDAVATAPAATPHPRPPGADLDVRQGRGRRHLGRLRPGELGPEGPGRLPDGRLVGAVPRPASAGPGLRRLHPVRHRRRPGDRPAAPPRLPLEGQATYAGQAGGLYAYALGSDWGEDEGANLLDEYEGAIAITADFAAGTLSGCIGCAGDLVTRRAHFDIFLGDDVRDVRAVAADYELHFGVTQLNDDGTFEHTGVEVRHPERSVTRSRGHWGGTLSNVPDRDGNPRLVAGFSDATFEESDGSAGLFYGTFVALSERLRASGAGDGRSAR